MCCCSAVHGLPGLPTLHPRSDCYSTELRLLPSTAPQLPPSLRVLPQNYWWVIFLELVPGWALFRGLYEISQYAFRGTTQNSKGITWSR